MTQNWIILSQAMPAYMGLVRVSYIKCLMVQKANSPRILNPSSGRKALFPDWKGGLGNNICSEKISPILAGQILYSTNRPQAPNNHYRIKKGLPIYTANRLLRWGTILLNYNFNIEYLLSKQISLADGLSRLVPKYSEPFEDTIIAALRTDCENKNVIANTIKELPMTLLKIKSEAMNDDFITNIKEKITAKNEKLSEVFSLFDNFLQYSERVVIPKKLQNRILRDFYTGHPGINRMKSLMRSYVYWPKMDNDIRDKIEKCKGCALAAKAPHTSFKP